MMMTVEWESLGVCCPRCLERLAAEGATQLRCATCRTSYDVHFGIPDLRTGEDPYLSRDEDLAAARALAARAPSTDFPSLLASYYASNDKVPPAQVAMFTHGTVAAADRAAATLAAWNRQDRRAAADGAARGAVLLDVGCGTAALAIAATQLGLRAVGVDVGLRWLVLARKRALEAGADVPLVCANVEVLPFRNGCAARAGGESILENAADPELALHELARVLRHDGRLWLTTPNKQSLGPDPHLGVIAGGWWPDAVLRRHAARTGKVFPRRTLFTAASLRRSLENCGFRQIAIGLPEISAAQARSRSLVTRTAITTYHIVKRLPVLGRMLRAVAPTYLVTATRA